MKKLIAVLAIIGCAIIGSSAQTNVNAIEPFYSTAYTWATSVSYDPSVAWTNQIGGNVELSTGVRQTTGTGAKDYIIAQYDLSRWNIGAEVDFFGVGAAINSGEIRGGYAIAMLGDFKLEANLGAGYGGNISGVLGLTVEPELAIKKKMTHNTFAEMRISEPIYFHGKFDTTPTIKVGVGFTF